MAQHDLFLATISLGEQRFVAGTRAPDATQAATDVQARLTAHQASAHIEQVLDRAGWITAYASEDWPSRFDTLDLPPGAVSLLHGALYLTPRCHAPSDPPDAPSLATERLGRVTAHPAGEVPEILKTYFAEGEGHALLLLDGAAITGLPELLETSGLQHRCLFRGDAADTMAAAAPWLVLAPADHPLTQVLFRPDPDMPARLHHANAICLLPGAQIETAERHFRRLTRVRAEEDQRWLYFRFCDARTLEDLRPVLTEDDARALLGAQGLVAVGHEARRFALADGVSAGDNQPRTSFVLRNAYVDAMSRRQRSTFRDTIVDALCGNFPLIEVQAEALADRALDFCGDVGLKGRDTVMGYTLLTGEYGADMVLHLPQFASLADPRRSESDRKTLIHAALRTLEHA